MACGVRWIPSRENDPLDDGLFSGFRLVELDSFSLMPGDSLKLGASAGLFVVVLAWFLNVVAETSGGFVPPAVFLLVTLLPVFNILRREYRRTGLSFAVQHFLHNLGGAPPPKEENAGERSDLAVRGSKDEISIDLKVRGQISKWESEWRKAGQIRVRVFDCENGLKTDSYPLEHPLASSLSVNSYRTKVVFIVYLETEEEPQFDVSVVDDCLRLVIHGPEGSESPE